MTYRWRTAGLIWAFAIAALAVLAILNAIGVI